jgi:L-methionine (R)-S-oxide reductase
MLMSEIVKLLHQRMLRYNWVGFYMLDSSPGQPPVLVLGPFQGAMTPHTRISLHQGICGAAASTGKTVVVDDVSKDTRYLGCSHETKSEIVVPIFVGGKVADLVGEPSGKTTLPGRSSLTSFNSLKVQGVSAAALFRPS